MLIYIINCSYSRRIDTTFGHTRKTQIHTPNLVQGVEKQVGGGGGGVMTPHLYRSIKGMQN